MKRYLPLSIFFLLSCTKIHSNSTLLEKRCFYENSGGFICFDSQSKKFRECSQQLGTFTITTIFMLQCESKSNKSYLKGQITIDPFQKIFVDSVYILKCKKISDDNTIKEFEVLDTLFLTNETGRFSFSLEEDEDKVIIFYNYKYGGEVYYPYNWD